MIIAGHAVVMVLGVFIASVSQVLLKKSAQYTYRDRFGEYLNWRVILAYGMMLSATLCSVYAYRVVPISLGMALDSSGYIFVTLFGLFIFKEAVTKRRFIALVLIIVGISLYALIG